MPKSSKSTSERTLIEIRKRGGICWKTEQYNQFAKKRIDLFHFIDVLAIVDGVLWGIQASHSSGLQAHLRKLNHEDVMPYVKSWLSINPECVKAAIWVWRKLKKGKRSVWKVKEVEVIYLPGSDKIIALPHLLSHANDPQ